MTSARDKARERKRRQRATERQAASIEFVRTDASLFLHPDRLSQKAGAPKAQLRRMAIKELVDNALDAALNVTLTAVDGDTFIIADDGSGIAPEKAKIMFSVTRPMMSTKLVRRPTRGAVGNGLRVATGAAFASGGSITVESQGVRQQLGFDRATGETVVRHRSASKVDIGTTITISFGAGLPTDPWATLWGDLAVRLAGASASPMLTHPGWYSELAFAELVEAARGTAQDLASLFGVDLCHAVSNIVDQGQSTEQRRDIDPEGPPKALSLDLLKALAPKPPKLVPLPDDAFPGAYKIERIEAVVGGGAVPAIIQAWAQSSDGKGRTAVDVTLVINRTPTIGDLSVYPGGDSWMKGCGLGYLSLGKVPKGSYRSTIAITTPAVLLVNDGKTPDLTPFKSGLANVIGPVLRRCHRPKTRDLTIKDAAYDLMEEAYLKASAGGTLPANARQIMYAARPEILERTGLAKLNDAYFTQVLLPAYIEENQDLTADWDVVYDARGHLVEPHTGHTVPLGTLQVRDYLRPRHTEAKSLVSTALGLYPTKGPGDRYNTCLFIEKEGFEPLLRAARIAERFDTAIMSTKGMSVIAARALVDRLSGDGVRILVAHDLDMAGIRIFGTLHSDSARYTFANQPSVQRLGLTLAQARDMDLQAERYEFEGDKDRILDGLRRHGATDDEVEFLGGGKRVELNAMPSDVFIAWIESRLNQCGVRKVVPDAATIETRARQVLGVQRLRRDVAALELQARQFAEAAELPADLQTLVAQALEMDSGVPWEDALATVLQGGGGAQ